MRIISFILFIVLQFCTVILSAQIKPKPTSPPPASSPPPPPPPAPVGSVGSTGFRLLKVPIVGDYKLGMSLKEYDSIAAGGVFTLQTAKDKYKLEQEPAFYKKRMAILSFFFREKNFSTEPDDIPALYEERFGAPDKKADIDSLETFPSVMDTVLKGQYRVKETYREWNFQYYDVFVWLRIVDTKDGSWKGSLTIRYYGNEKYLAMLRELE